MVTKSKILLIHPPISRKERYTSHIGSAGGNQIPLGIYYLASVLRNNEYEVNVIDAASNLLSSEDVINFTEKFKPKYIGISSTTVSFHRAVELATMIKKRFKDITIILGGTHITSNPYHAMGFREFDYGVLQEGEITIIELLNVLDSDNDISKIKGIAYRDNDKVILTKPRSLICNIDEIPIPAYDLIPDLMVYSPPQSSYKALPLVNIITSRGCPCKCIFCDRNTFGEKYRMRSAENIYEEIKYLTSNFGVKEIAFVDDNFLLNKKRIYKLFDIFKKENIRISWTCLSRIDSIDYELLKFIRDNGCWQISFGIESGNQEILNIMKKNISLEKVPVVLNWCKNLGLKTKGFFIIGNLGETEETIEDTINFACSVPLDEINVTINTPFPGTEQYSKLSDYGYLDNTDWAEFNLWRPVFIPEGLSKEILINKHKKMYRKFYFRPKMIIRYLISLFNKEGLKRLKLLLQASLYVLKDY